jgi:NADPH:quinone reductase-like Zn-dependent oxidoreductase
MSDDPVQLDVNPIIFNDVRVRGFWLLPWLQSSTAETQGEVYGELTQEIIAGRLHAAVSARYSLEELQKAIAATEAIGRKGKVLFAPNGV